MLSLRLNYIVIPLLAVITGSAASYFADSGRAWYGTINLPMWFPSNSVMFPVWTIILLLSAVSVLIVWNKYSKQKNFYIIIGLFILSAIISVGWNIFFFSHQQIGLAFIQSVLLISNIILLIVLIWEFCPVAASCLIPYSMWVLFSTVFTFNVWLMN
ncbi:MAG: tryptophan-rich sensory protein [Ignavibacteria bacterium]|jgi:tryptophan-rich sensory protein